MGSIKKTVSDIIQLGPATVLGNIKTVKECPKCGSKLNTSSSMVQLYYCGKCGYHGPIALNPLDKQAAKVGKKRIS
jgi:predicted RNA-binding Zn-ribbon protein involved in translation (DUF1610 family)